MDRSSRAAALRWGIPLKPLTVDFVVILALIGTAWASWEARGWWDSQKARPVVLRHVTITGALPAAQYFQCPATPSKIREWVQKCKDQKRSDSTKQSQGDISK